MPAPSPSSTPQAPEAFKVTPTPPAVPEPDAADVGLRGVFRALGGMQKEAVVHQDAPPGASWRVVSDEGPYLQGTDLAPYPLAFFAAALQASLLTTIAPLAAETGVALADVTCEMDTRYTMRGSALRGDMTGGAEPAELRVSIAADASPGAIVELVRRALDASPVHAAMREPVASRFALVANRVPVVAEGLEPPRADIDDPVAAFESLAPATAVTWWPDLITRTAVAPDVHGVPGGAGSSLQAEQKRTLHVVSTGRLVASGAVQVSVGMRQPVGSTFRFLAAGGPTAADGPAPSALSYFMAGVGFCFLTQLGRYAHITKQPVAGARLVQHGGFRRLTAGHWAPLPMLTHVFLDLDGDRSTAARMVAMGRQTCFLHAALRTALPSRLAVVLNGVEATVPGDEAGRR